MWPLPHSIGSHMHALCLQVTLTIAALGKKEDLLSQVLGKVSVPVHHTPFRYIGRGDHSFASVKRVIQICEF